MLYALVESAASSQPPIHMVAAFLHLPGLRRVLHVSICFCQ